MNRTMSGAINFGQATLFGHRAPELRRGLLVLLSALVVVLAVLPATAASVIYGVLALHALRGQRQVVEAFTVLFLVLMSNPVLQPAEGGTLRWLVIFSGFGRALWDSFFNSGAIRVPFQTFGILLAFLSWAALGAALSAAPVLSVLKLTSFAVGVLTVFIAFSSTVHLADYWRSWFHTFFVFILAVSALILPTGLGYIRTTQGFQGVFSHPQIMGPMAGLAAAWFTGLFMSTEQRPGPVVVGGMGASWILLFFSAARTGAAAVGGGLIVTFLLLGFSRVKISAWGGIKSARVWISGLVILTGLVLGGGTIVSNLTDFVFKDDTAGVSAEELFDATRGNLVAQSMDNFYRSPLVGIGFGVPSDLARTDSDTEVMGIPVSASTEKGFMPTAILEEVGIVGAVLVLLFLWVISRSVIRWGGLRTSWIFWAALLINVGAAVFFSIGGLGFFVWMMIGYCYGQSEAKKITMMEESSRRVGARRAA